MSPVQQRVHEMVMAGEIMSEAERLHRRIVAARQEMKMPAAAIQKVSREGLGLYQMGEKTMGPYQVLSSLGRRNT
jgi:hypothetical protein